MELPSSASSDAVLCGMTADLDLDGSVEVLLGTYGRQLLVYKWDSNAWDLRATRTLCHPVHSLHYLDVTGDGVRELLILTPKGLHVFQVKYMFACCSHFCYKHVVMIKCNSSLFLFLLNSTIWNMWRIELRIL